MATEPTGQELHITHRPTLEEEQHKTNPKHMRARHTLGLTGDTEQQVKVDERNGKVTNTKHKQAEHISKATSTTGIEMMMEDNTETRGHTHNTEQTFLRTI